MGLERRLQVNIKDLNDYQGAIVRRKLDVVQAACDLIEMKRGGRATQGLPGDSLRSFWYLPITRGDISEHSKFFAARRVILEWRHNVMKAVVFEVEGNGKT